MPSALPFPEQVSLAREAALRLLSVRERSDGELRIRLKQKGFEADAVVAALDRLREVGLQSDSRFAERYAESAAARGHSARRIQGDLRARGLEPELAAAAAASSPEDERERALQIAERRGRALRGKPPEVIARRIAGMLARRGYDAETCRTVAAEVAGDDLIP